MGMIDAKQAKDILGCDDATLQQHVNSGAVKAQRQGGKLLVDEDDVQRLAKKEDEEGTIVLTGESDNLQIDLGKVVDDSSETIVQAKATNGAKDSQAITFGEELEVVSLEDNKQQDLGQTKPTTAAQGLSFTDSNTAVMTSVEETAVGNTTAPIETGPQQGARPLPAGESGRRSVRSSRRAPEVEVEVPWYWFACLALAFAIGAFLIIPFYVVGNTSSGKTDYGGNVLRGVDDNVWTGMAGSIAGFCVEPNAEKWKKEHPGAEYKDISLKDVQAKWRYRLYEGDLKADKVESYHIVKVSDDGTKAYGKTGTKEWTISKAADGSETVVLDFK